MMLLNGIGKYLLFESQSEDTSHGNQLEYFVPATFSNILVFLFSTKLLLSGDIELNPGPLGPGK